MYTRDYRDIGGGLALIVLGISVVIYASGSLNMGTLNRMGPGMFPFGLGCILAMFGAIILIPALFREGQGARVDVRSMILIVAAIMVFALMIRPFGMIPTIIVMSLIASFADSKLSPLGAVVLSVALALVAALVFRVALGMQMAAFAWPW